MSIREIDGEIRAVLAENGVMLSKLDPVVAPNLRLELGDFSTDAPLRLLKAGFKGERYGRVVTELIGRLEACGCEVLQVSDTDAGATQENGVGGQLRGGLGYLNFKVPRLSGSSEFSAVSRVADERGVGGSFKIVVVAPTAGLEARSRVEQQRADNAKDDTDANDGKEVGVKGERVQLREIIKGKGGSSVGCHGAAYLRSVARGLVQALLIRERLPEAKLELILGEHSIDVTDLDTRRAGKVLVELARNNGQQLDGRSQEQALALLESHLEVGAESCADGRATQTHIWLSANSVLPELFKSFFGRFGKRAKFHFSAASWDEGVAAIPGELLEGIDEQSFTGVGSGAGLGTELGTVGVDEAALGVGFLWCLAGERGGAEFDWYSGVLSEWDNLVWATRVLEHRLARHLGAQEVGAGTWVEQREYTLPIQPEFRGVMLRSLTLPMWVDRAAITGDVESLMVVWRDWLNRSNRFLNQPATGMLPKEWHEIVPSLKAGLSVTMRLIQAVL